MLEHGVNRADGGATGSRLAAGSQDGNRLCGSISLPSIAQCAGRGTTRPRSPSSIEKERRCASISPNGARSWHDVRSTGSVGWDRARSPTPSGATRNRGGEAVPTDNGRASGGLSHPPARSQQGGQALSAGGGAQNHEILSTATAGCGPGLRGLKPDVSRRSSCRGELRLEGGVMEPAPARSQHG